MPTLSALFRIGGDDSPHADKREAIHRMIQDAITRDLGEHGLVRVDSVETLVGYLVIAGNNARPPRWMTTQSHRRPYRPSGPCPCGLHRGAMSPITTKQEPRHRHPGRQDRQAAGAATPPRTCSGTFFEDACHGGSSPL